MAELMRQTTGGVWVYVEHVHGTAHSVSWELLTPARQIADALGTEVGVVIIGDSGARAATEAFAYGADAAYTVEGPAYFTYRTEPHTRAMAHLLRKHAPEVLLLGATVTGRDLASAVAVEMGTGLTADCTQLDVNREQRLLEMTRPAFGGNLMATIVCEHARPQMATVRPRVMPMPARQAGRMGRIVREELPLSELEVATRVLRFVPAAIEGAELAAAEVVVAAGRGVGGAEPMALVEELAAALGGVVAGSRAAVDMGWIPASRQVGQTGKTVRPRVYIACGISGAVQHLVGMQHAGAIIAINTDPRAPIFSVATLGIVGDVRAVVPELIRQARQARGQRAA